MENIGFRIRPNILIRVLTETAIMDKREGLHGMKVSVMKCEVGERQAPLQQEKANMAAELQAMEDQQVVSASAEQHDDGG